MLAQMTPEQQATLRLKILGYVLLGNRTKHWGMNLRWQGDYLAMPVENNDAETYKQAVLGLQSSGTFRRVIFSSMIYKLSHRVGRPETNGTSRKFAMRSALEGNTIVV